MVTVYQVLKDARALVVKGWAPEEHFNGWCGLELPPGGVFDTCDHTQGNATLFSVDGAIARAAGLWAWFADPVGVAAKDALEAVTSPAWVADMNLRLPPVERCTPAQLRHMLRSAQAAAASPPIDAWLRDPKRQQSDVIEVFNVAIAKAGRR